MSVEEYRQYRLEINRPVQSQKHRRLSIFSNVTTPAGYTEKNMFSVFDEPTDAVKKIQNLTKSTDQFHPFANTNYGDLVSKPKASVIGSRIRTLQDQHKHYKLIDGHKSKSGRAYMIYTGDRTSLPGAIPKGMKMRLHAIFKIGDSKDKYLISNEKHKIDFYND